MDQGALSCHDRGGIRPAILLYEKILPDPGLVPNTALSFSITWNFVYLGFYAIFQPARIT